MHVNELQIEKHVKHILEKENKQKNDTNTFLLTFKFITKQKQISPLPRPLNMGRFHQMRNANAKSKWDTTAHQSLYPHLVNNILAKNKKRTKNLKKVSNFLYLDMRM